MFLLGLFLQWLIYCYVKSEASIFFILFWFARSVRKWILLRLESNDLYKLIKLSFNLLSVILWQRIAYCFGCDGVHSWAFFPEHQFRGLDDPLLLCSKCCWSYFVCVAWLLPSTKSERPRQSKVLGAVRTWTRNRFSVIFNNNSQMKEESLSLFIGTKKQWNARVCPFRDYPAEYWWSQNQSKFTSLLSALQQCSVNKSCQAFSSIKLL